MKSYSEFISEGKKGPTNAGSIMKTDNVTKVKTSVNFSDETLENLRRKMLDKYWAKFDSTETEKRETVNKCISTFIYCLDKKMRIDGDIMDLMAKTLEMSSKDLNKEMTEMTEKHYGESPNLYGMT